MLKDEAFLIKCSKYLKPQYFAKYIDYFFEKLTGYYDKYNEVPGTEFFQTELKKFRPEDREPYLKIFTNMYNPRSTISEQYIRDHIEGYIKCNKFKDLYEGMYEEYEAENPDKVINFVEDGLDEIRRVNFDNSEIFGLEDALQMMEEVAAQRKPENAISLGIEEIDNALLGGIIPGDVALVLADTNVGKSIALVNFAARVLKQNKKVLMLFTEGKKHEPILRLITRMSNRKLQYKNLVTGKFGDNDEDLEIVHGIINKNKDKFLVKSMVTLENPPTIEDVIGTCKEIYSYFQFDAVIIDYADMLDTKRKITEKRFKDEQVWLGLCRIAKYFHVPVITASQATRAKNRKLIRVNDVAESYYKSRLSSVILTLNRNDKEVELNRMRILLDKAREGKNRVLIEQNTDYDRMILFGHKNSGLTSTRLDLSKNNDDSDEED